MSDREHFEAWLRRRFPRGEIHVSNGEYEHQTTQHQYEAFVAGMAVKQDEVEALRKALHEIAQHSVCCDARHAADKALAARPGEKG